MISLVLKEIADFYIRKNFETLQKYLKDENKLDGFKFIELQLEEAVSGKKISHGLGAVPNDLLVLRNTGPGTVTWNYDSFTSEELSVTVTGAVSKSNPQKIRLFVGNYSSR